MSTERESIGARLEAVREGWTTERFVLVALVALVLASFGPSFQVYLLTEFLIVALFALAFNLLYGYTGLLSFGHAMFFAAGGYSTAVAFRDLQQPVADAVGTGPAPLVTFLVGGVLGLLAAAVLAVPVGYLSVRLEEIYFALITLAFGMLFYTTLYQNPAEFTNGSDGIILLLGVVELGGMEFSLGERRIYYYLTLAVVVASVYAIWRLVNSPFGTVCKALRESPERASALGVNVSFHRWVTFVVSALFTGLAGVLAGGLYGVVSPDMSHWSTSADPVVATVIGGANYFIGPIVGAFVYLYVRWGISQFPTLEAHWEFVFGAMLVVVVLFFKQGAAGGVYMLRDRLADRRGGDGGDER
ncbi:branched-chain amino acid ABC transporter permease [Natrialbaceae archaeon GCM10025810]|uniref:branched-chain amino acid ABC transporter permease n=1 Tax=Halovalidus salilacus TaxID=3075124 RepID=UPI003614A8FE